MPVNTTDVHSAAVSLANQLLVRFDVAIPRISSLSDLPPSFYTTLFEAIFQTSVPDIVDPQQCTVEEEIHNIQSIIDTLSMDVLNVSLSHITGEAVIAGDPQSIYYLLEIFFGYVTLVTTSFDSQNASPYGIDRGRPSCELCKTNAARLEPIVTKFQTNEEELFEHVLPLLTVHNITAQKPELEEGFFKSFKKCKSEVITSQDGASVPEKLETENSIAEENAEKDADSGWMSHFSSDTCVTTSGKQETFVSNVMQQNRRTEPLTKLPTSELPRSSRCDDFDLRQARSTRDQVTKLKEHQLRFLTSRLHSIFAKRMKPKQLYDDAIQRQKDLFDMENKNIAERRRLKLQREETEVKTKIRSAFNAHSLQRVRTKQYFGKYYLQHKNKMMSRDKTTEEVILVGLLKKRLALQKEELHTLNRDIRQHEQEQFLEDQAKIASLENFYDDQLSMLREREKQKKSEYEIRKKAQAQKIREIRIENRHKLENEIKQMQDAIFSKPFT